MKYYLAATYSRNAEMRKYRDELAELGHKVTSRWIDTALTREPVAWGADKIAARPAEARGFAATDLEDIRLANAVIYFSKEIGGEPTKGGRLVEYGYALALKKLILIVGPYENVFSSLAGDQFDTWEELYEALAAKARK